MIRFRNPGTQYTTQIQVFKELYNDYKDVESFGLDEMASTITRCSLMTAYGYGGENALALSNTENESLNSTKMNAKMYAEVFRLLGWITSAGKSSYPLVFTYIGEHVARMVDVLPLYEECVLGINNPQQIMDVKYDEKVRFFKAALFSLADLDGVMYKHEFCLGPMSIDDLDEGQYRRMIAYISKLRGSFSRYQNAYGELCESLGVKPTLPDNSTRLPIAFMKTCGWVESVRTKELYPPKSLECLRLTKHGYDKVVELKEMKDLRIEELEEYDESKQRALMRLGAYSMLSRAGFDTSTVNSIIENDKKECKDILEGKQLLFSPYQTLRHEIVDDALGIVRTNKNRVASTYIPAAIDRNQTIVSNITFNLSNEVKVNTGDTEMQQYIDRINAMKESGKSKKQIVSEIFEECRTHKEAQFYPFIAMLFRVMGLNGKASRRGDNGSRADVMIVDDKYSIPVEVKSPTEVEYISLKAIRQAVENKVIILSHEEYKTTKDTTSLAVGYYLPSDRAEISNLIQDVKNAYGFNIGVIDLMTMLEITTTIICDNKTFDLEQLFRLEGYAATMIK